MATELAADNIRANSILAGFTASKSVLNHPAMMEKIRPHTINARMIKRDTTPDDLCGTAVFLASAASAFITGQAIEVDGGAITYQLWLGRITLRNYGRNPRAHWAPRRRTNPQAGDRRLSNRKSPKCSRCQRRIH